MSCGTFFFIFFFYKDKNSAVKENLFLKKSENFVIYYKIFKASGQDMNSLPCPFQIR